MMKKRIPVLLCSLLMLTACSGDATGPSLLDNGLLWKLEVPDPVYPGESFGIVVQVKNTTLRVREVPGNACDWFQPVVEKLKEGLTMSVERLACLAGIWQVELAPGETVPFGRWIAASVGSEALAEQGLLDPAPPGEWLIRVQLPGGRQLRTPMWVREPVQLLSPVLDRGD